MLGSPFVIGSGLRHTIIRPNKKDLLFTTLKSKGVFFVSLIDSRRFLSFSYNIFFAFLAPHLYKLLCAKMLCF